MFMEELTPNRLDQILTDLVDLVASKDKIRVIKLVREIMGWDLRSAMDYVNMNWSNVEKMRNDLKAVLAPIDDGFRKRVFNSNYLQLTINRRGGTREEMEEFFAKVLEQVFDPK